MELAERKMCRTARPVNTPAENGCDSNRGSRSTDGHVQRRCLLPNSSPFRGERGMLCPRRRKIQRFLLRWDLRLLYFTPAFVSEAENFKTINRQLFFLWQDNEFASD